MAAPRTDPGAHPQDGPAAASRAVEIQGVSKAFGGPPVLTDVSLRAEPGAMVALLGPSGCGKTTLLRIIAGLEVPDAGAVHVGGADVTRVAPEDRRIGMVFQDWALFPHLTVAKNVAYGVPRDVARSDRVEEALAMVGLAGLGDRMPATLSGGQQQRVALARALAPEPSVLLLDEPFSNLDTVLRVQVRSEVHALLVELGITTLFVTHDQEEAFVLGDSVAVMNEGRIVQHAAPAEIYRRPADPWVATFVGEANLLAGTAAEGVAQTAIGALPLEDGAPDGAVAVLVRPEHLQLVPAGEGTAGGVVSLLEYYGHDTVYVVDVGGEPVRVREGAGPTYQRGDTVALHYRPTAAVAYPSGS